MAAELLLTLARCNLAASLAILIVWPLRAPLRRWLGAQHAYAAWLIVPLAALGSLMPTDLASGAAGLVEQTSNHWRDWLCADGRARGLGLIWLGGMLAAITLVGWRHALFLAAIRAGRAGPAAVGVMRPRLVVPADFTARFTQDERRLVCAHELAHMDRLDARYNAAAALATSVCWFNPLLHLAAHAMRLDQELACDAAVLDRQPGARRLYAETLLRAHSLTAAPVLGCQWRSGSAHPLVARLRMLGSTPPSQVRREIGVAILIAAWATAFCAAWALQPPVRAAAQPMVILVDLAPPTDAQARLGAAIYRDVRP